MIRFGSLVCSLWFIFSSPHVPTFKCKDSALKKKFLNVQHPVLSPFSLEFFKDAHILTQDATFSTSSASLCTFRRRRLL
jgi:hypothetical protein